MMPKNTQPPRWAQSLLRKLANAATVEEVEGDLLQLYALWEKQYGRRRARWRYIRTVITLLRPAQKIPTVSVTNLSPMIKSYFTMSWRALLRNRVSSLINFAGLTLGLTTSLIILLVVLHELQVDQFHTNKDSIMLVIMNQKTNDGVFTGRATPGPMAEMLRADFTEVRHAARMARFDEKQVEANGMLRSGNGLFVDLDFFRIMTFPAIEGNAAEALGSNSGVITKTMAKKLFGNEDPVGKIIVFDRHHNMTIGAVIDDPPAISSIRFEMAIPFSVFEKENDWLQKWDDNRIQTLVQLQPSTDVASLNSQLSSTVQKITNNPLVTLFVYPFKDLYLHGNFSNGHASGGKIVLIQLLIGFGVFMLLIACINFMNIATAQSEHRAREVGVRKVLGASRPWIVFQFLNESFVITFLSLSAAVALTVLVIPSFNTLTHSSISFDFTSASVWGATLSVGVLTALLAGSYPAFFLSRFMPALVLKGKIGNLKGLLFRRALVTFQFAISIFVLTGTVILYAQFDHIKNRPMGYEQENLINIQLDSLLSAKFSYVKEAMSEIPGVRSATGSAGNILYSQGAITGMDWPGKKPGEDLSVVVTDVEYDWCKTMGISLKLGRDFDPAFKSDEGACLLNESAVEKMGLKDPVGSMINGNRVIGVFQNFVYNNPSGIIAPMAVYLGKPGRMNHLYLRIDNNTTWRKTLAQVEKSLKTISPDQAFKFTFTKEEYQVRFNEVAQTGVMVSIFGGMTIFISCLGLFGLSGFVAERRGREMSVRKVFGATALRILLSLTQDFLKPVMIALLLTIPLSLWVAGSVLSNINYRVPLSWWMFAYAGAIILVVALLVVLYHGWKAARENPAVRLRSE
jgi:ABC-type antimicrobial peptide transport system permease subunit